MIKLKFESGIWLPRSQLDLEVAGHVTSRTTGRASLKPVGTGASRKKASWITELPQEKASLGIPRHM